MTEEPLDAITEQDEHDDGVEDLAWPIPMATIVPLAAAFVALMVWGFGSDRVLISIIPFVVLLAVLTVIDLRELRVPNRLLQPAYLLAIPLLPLAATSDWAELSLLRALFGALALGAIYFVIAMIYPPGMGWGDVKLAPLLGAQLALFGWIPFVRSIIISHFASGIVAVVILLIGMASRGRIRWRVAFPFAPFMVLGAVAALVLEATTA
ncbi:MAG: A24 family peptidase [Actinomycetota bacterium]